VLKIIYWQDVVYIRVISDPVFCGIYGRMLSKPA